MSALGSSVLPPLPLPVEIEQAIIEQSERARANAEAIALQHGSRAAYRDSLRPVVIETPNNPLLAPFYDLYARVFTLADEREPLEGFTSVLAFNDDAAVQNEFGPFREPILAAIDPQSGDIVAAVNFTLYAYPGSVYDFDASCQMHFLMVREDLRGLGIGRHSNSRSGKSIATFSHTYCGVTRPRAFITCEQNNPARMTHDEILADARAALIHPYARMNWWRQRGFRRLDFNYMQPPLSPDHAPCTYLDYYARPSNASTEELSCIPSDVLTEHLRRFFFVSVGKLCFRHGCQSAMAGGAS